MNKKQSYLEEAQAYYDQAMRRAMDAQVRRSLVIRAGTLGALGGASAINALLAACGAGGEAAKEVQRTIEKAEGKEALLYPQFHPFASKYNWRNLPWPTTPYVGGIFVDSGGGISNWALLTNARTSDGGRHWQTPMVQLYGAGVSLDRPPVVPFLADRATNAPDYSYYDYHIRPNSYFHDHPPVNGRLATAEDMRYSLELWRTNSVVTATMDAIERITVLPDKETVRVHLKRPVLWINYLLAAPNYHIFAKEHYEGDQDVWKQVPIGTGAWKVVKSIPREGTWMVPNKGYSYVDSRWPDYKLPFLRERNRIYTGDAAVRKSGFRSKQLDTYTAAGVVEINDVLATNPEATFQINVGTGRYGTNWMLNNRDPLLKDVRVRRALNMALDRKTMMTTLSGGMGMITHPITWNQVGRDAPYTIEEAGPYMQYNPVRARELLAEAGYPNGFELERLTSSVTEELEMIAKYMSNIGVRVKWDRQESSVVSNKELNRDYKHAIGRYAPSAIFAVKPARELYMPDSPLNRGWVNDPVLTEIIEKATYSLDADEQLRLLESVNQRAFDQCYDLETVHYWQSEFWHPYLQNRANAVSGYASIFGCWQEAINWVSDKAPGDRGGKLRA